MHPDSRWMALSRSRYGPCRPYFVLSWPEIALLLLVLPMSGCLLGSGARGAAAMSIEEQSVMRGRVQKMFYHAYDSYMLYAFPHDELRPISRSFTDSLGELGNLNHEHLSASYEGSALTLLDSLSSLAVLGNVSEFRRAVQWVSTNIAFDLDVRVNVFECTIRMLGGLLSGHLLALLQQDQKQLDLNQQAHPGPCLNTNPRPHTLRTSFGPSSSSPRYNNVSSTNLGPQHGATPSRLCVPMPGHMAAGPGVPTDTFSPVGSHASGTCASVSGMNRRLEGSWEGVHSVGSPWGSASGTGSPCYPSPRPSAGAGGAFVAAASGASWYQGELLRLALDLGQRLLPAFDSPTGIPYAWVNLKYGVRANETAETSTSGCGTLILEFGLLSRLTGQPQFEAAARDALLKVWHMRSPLDLMGTTLDVERGVWLEPSAGIGAGVDSFFEYLLKAYILFGDEQYWGIFHIAYSAVQRHYLLPQPRAWYQDAHMLTGRPTYRQFTSLQAFWPALQVLAGDVAAANVTHRQFYSVWKKYGLLPERYLYDTERVHPTEKYYPLRPELAESTYALYQATRDPFYLRVGKHMVEELEKRTRVEGGYASVKNVETGELEDHQHSFFLAETCKYLYLLFDKDAVLRLGVHNFIFSTEGHILPIQQNLNKGQLVKESRHPVSIRNVQVKHRRGRGSISNSASKRPQQARAVARGSAMDRRLCPNPFLDWDAATKQGQFQGLQQGLGVPLASGAVPKLPKPHKRVTRGSHGGWLHKPLSICHVPDGREDHTCESDGECGVEAASCKRRTCSPARFCATWPL